MLNGNKIIRLFILLIVAFNLVGISSCVDFNFDWGSNPSGIKQQSIKDIDGNEYVVVNVGSQAWLFNDLRTTRYNNGDSISTTQPATLDISVLSDPCFQWPYNGLFGRYYTWSATTDSRKICPVGWHVPTVQEWNVLINYLGGASIAGEKLKIGGGWNDFSSSQSQWVLPFQPVGKRESNGEFIEYMTNGYWWAFDAEDSNKLGVYYYLVTGSKEVFKNNYDKNAGMCIRCIQD